MKRSSRDALDTLVFGVDVQSGDARGGNASYAFVEIDDSDEFGIERDVVTRRKLLREVESRKPDYLATDNVYEIAEDKHSLVLLLKNLPPETTLVQVTGDERPEPLSRVAGRHDVPYGKKPIEEAEASARLAYRKVGFAVEAFEDTTQVKVSRGRSTGKGGWSEDRYTRRIHGNVKSKARDVEKELEAEGFSYDKDVTKKYGGYSSAVYKVKAPESDLPFSDVRNGDVRVEVEPVRKDGIEFRPLMQRRDYVLVGIDPGTTTAAAVVDLDGNVLDATSTRTGDLGDVIEWIVENGRPVVVAADVTPMPDTVEKIKRSFDAYGWVPERDLKVNSKKRIVSEKEYVPKDDHQRDALAAALTCYGDMEPQFSKVREKVPRELEFGMVLKKVLTEESTVESVLNDLIEDEESEDNEEEGEERELTEEEKRIHRLENQVDRLKSYVDDLESELEEKKDEVNELEGRLAAAKHEGTRRIREQKEVKKLETARKELKRELREEKERRTDLEEKFERLKKLWKVEHSDIAGAAKAKNYTVVKPIDKFTKSALREADEEFGLAEDDVLYLRDASGAGRSTAELMAEIDPRLVLKSGGMSRQADEILFENDIPVGDIEDVAIRNVDNLAITRDTDVEDVIDDWRKKAEERRLESKREMVDQLINEYRVKRKDSV
ncbi:MAG: DUF460 domain-containing protein [Halobacteria archaeon]